MKSHPLEPEIRAAFKERAHHDAASLMPHLTKDDLVRSRYRDWVSARNRIYREVQKALNVMERQRLLYRDERGWYYLADENAPSGSG